MSTLEDEAGSTNRSVNWRYNSAALNRMKAFLGIVELWRARVHHRRRGRYGRRLPPQARAGEEPLLCHDRTGRPFRGGFRRLHQSLIRRGLLAGAVGVPLLVLLTVLALVFRSVILAPPAPRSGGTFVEGVVGQLGSLNPPYGAAKGGADGPR